MADAGRPNELEPNLEIIKQMALDAQPLVAVAKALGLSERTVYGWHSTNYAGFADLWLSWKHERMLRKAETNLDRLMDSEDDRLQLDASKFVAETLGNKHYNKKQNTDITTGGKPFAFDISFKDASS